MTSSHFLSRNNSTTHINLSTPLIGTVTNKSPYLCPEGTQLTKKLQKVVEIDLPVCVIVVCPKHKCCVHRKQPCWHTASWAIKLTLCSLCQTSLSLGKGQGSNTSMFPQNIFFKAVPLMSGGATFYWL